jgi:hypothetical protein
MKRLPLLAATALALVGSLTAAVPAMAQQAGPVPMIEAGHTLLTVTATSPGYTTQIVSSVMFRVNP